MIVRFKVRPIHPGVHDLPPTTEEKRYPGHGRQLRHISSATVASRREARFSNQMTSGITSQ